MEASSGISAKVINLTRFKLEEHVKKAFRISWQLSEGKPVNASHMLRSVLLVKQKYSSAFSEIASILSLSTPSEPTGTNVPPADLNAMPFVKPMAEAISVAERYIQDTTNRFWGRDYITTALLAVKDPSLSEIVSEAGTPIKTIQDKWFDYVSKTEDRRKRESWKQWWEEAGVSLPDSELPTSKPLPAYLLTWNPKEKPWPELKKNIETIEKRGSVLDRWSMRNYMDVTIGARVYLLKQGAEPQGLVGTGIIASEVTEDVDGRKKSTKVLYAEINWDALYGEPIVDRTELPVQSEKEDMWSTQSSGIQISPELAKDIAMLWKTAWERHKQGGIPELEARQWIARFSADTGSKDDQLRIERYVNAFARVIASRNLTPPLSIGLFGDWGSGKTFFMELLHDKIAELCKEEPEVVPPLYWRSICQIHFNAWHYAETNLWASLVSTIFNELRVYLDGNKEDSDEFNQLLNQLLNELEVASELRKQAQEKLNAAIKDHEKAQNDVETAEQELAQLPDLPKPSDEELRSILSKSVKDEFDEKAQTLANLLRSAGESSGRDDLEFVADNIDKGITTIEEARMLMDETESLSSRAGFWWRILSTAKFHRSKTFWIITIILIAIPVISIIIQKVFHLSQMWPHFWALIAEILTASGAAIAWMRSQLANAGGVFDKLNSFQKSIERKIEDARLADRLSYETKRDDAIMQKKKAQEELEKAINEKERAAKAEAEAEKAFRESTSKARLGRFIRERASSADYEKHLGLIAMVHRDFKKLSDLMEKMRKDDVDSNLRRIERIVLYVDDLDRCRPEKVVQVLEAIHLLLFFPLFVVVVGVDSRWIFSAEA